MAAEELTAAENFVLDMLGDELKSAVIEARERLADDTIMARISQSFVFVERGTPAAVIDGDMTIDEAVVYLQELGL